MASPDERPLLFLDVDGPLIPFRARPAGRSFATSDVLGSAQASGNPLINRLDPADGCRLLALGCHLVWATSRMSDANEVVAPRLGLPELPVVDFPDDDEEPQDELHWKTKCLSRWAGGRRFVWLDDEITDADRQWVEAHHPARALLHRVDPFVGLAEADFTVIRQWITGDNSA